MLAHSIFLIKILTGALSALRRKLSDPRISVQRRTTPVSRIPESVASKPQTGYSRRPFSQFSKYLRANARSPSEAWASAFE
jgi:hypothetical protein